MFPHSRQFTIFNDKTLEVRVPSNVGEYDAGTWHVCKHNKIRVYPLRRSMNNALIFVGIMPRILVHSNAFLMITNVLALEYCYVCAAIETNYGYELLPRMAANWCARLYCLLFQWSNAQKLNNLLFDCVKFVWQMIATQGAHKWWFVAFVRLNIEIYSSFMHIFNQNDR